MTEKSVHRLEHEGDQTLAARIGQNSTHSVHRHASEAKWVDERERRPVGFQKDGTLAFQNLSPLRCSLA